MPSLPIRFRISIVHLVGLCTLGWLLGVLIGFLLSLPFGLPQPDLTSPSATGAFACSVVLILFAIAVIVIGYPTTILATGLRVGDMFGIRRNLLWEKIVRVKPFSLLGFRYVQLTVAGSWFPIWLPLYHIEQKRFEAIVCDVAPSGNPLRIFFEGRQSEPSSPV